MLVRNDTHKKIVAYGWLSNSGHSDDVVIEPSTEREVNGPITGPSGKLTIPGNAIITDETPTKVDCYQIMHQILPIGLVGNPSMGITVRYYSKNE